MRERKEKIRKKRRKDGKRRRRIPNILYSLRAQSSCFPRAIFPPREKQKQKEVSCSSRGRKKEIIDTDVSPIYSKNRRGVCPRSPLIAGARDPIRYLVSHDYRVGYLIALAPRSSFVESIVQLRGVYRPACRERGKRDVLIWRALMANKKVLTLRMRVILFLLLSKSVYSIYLFLVFGDKIYPKCKSVLKNIFLFFLYALYVKIKMFYSRALFPVTRGISRVKRQLF